MNTMNPDKKERYLAAKRRLFDKVYGVRLNERQREAVFCAKGPLLVLAGAGSGKTTVLVNRISYLIKYGNAYHSETIPQSADLSMTEALEAAAELSLEEIEEILPEFISEPCPPWALLAFTFTNKAAKEIRERLERVFPDPEVSSSVWTGTFHSICLRILRRYGELLGYAPGFSIYDTDDSKRLISICMKELSIDEKRLAPKAVQGAISRAKDRLETPDKFEIERDPRTKEIREIYKLYQKKLREYNAMDFDDIIMQTVHLLETYEEPRSYYQRKFRYVLVDEYQDTNYAQFVLTKLLSDRERNIMVVGDDDQSIYKFRGANIRNILDFEKVYPEAKVIKLEQNYRSTQNVLDAANHVIRNNVGRKEKALWTDKGAGSQIHFKQFDTAYDEAEFIAEDIRQKKREAVTDYGQCAVLFRTNAQARLLEERFVVLGIPYDVVGGVNFYARREIKDLLAYLKTVDNGKDDVAVKRIINIPKRGIGAATIARVQEYADERQISFYDALRESDQIMTIGRSASKLEPFVTLIQSFRGKLEYYGIRELLQDIIDTTGYVKALEESDEEDAESRIENIEELMNKVVAYEESHDEPTLSEFLEEVALVADIDGVSEDDDKVLLMTLHSAKGLEFSHVYIAGMEDGVFPSYMTITSDDPAEIEEERRLAYVGITRAKDDLTLTCARARMLRGETQYNMVSRFVREIPEELLDHKPPTVKKREWEEEFHDTSLRNHFREKPFGGAGGSFGSREGAGFGGRMDTVYRLGGGIGATRPANDPRPRPKAVAAPRRTAQENRPFFTKDAGLSSLSKGTPTGGKPDYGEGDRVKHIKYGEGTVQKIEQGARDYQVTVDFDKVGTKVMYAAFAKLKKL